MATLAKENSPTMATHAIIYKEKKTIIVRTNTLVVVKECLTTPGVGSLAAAGLN